MDIHTARNLSPRDIVNALDKHIIGQNQAKRAVAIALRSRWRRARVEEELRAEITPKNILMVGPTGVGKTEISRRLAKLTGAPFIKVEATKFTEIGYVGRDVEQIIRDLMEIAITQGRETRRQTVCKKAETNAIERMLDALVGKNATPSTRDSFRQKLINGELDDKSIDLELQDNRSPFQGIELPGQPANSGMSMGMMDLSDLLGAKGRTKAMNLKIKDAYAPLLKEEADKMINEDSVIKDAVEQVENHGIVFLDEIDKITARSDERAGQVSREGVQRDLLPLIEGTSVNTKYGTIKTDHILFIASGAFHLARPCDLLPELQGRLPIRVELRNLSEEDFKRILTEPQASLIRQYTALLHTEGVTITFAPEAINAIAKIAATLNARIENIGARRLHTVIEKLLDTLNFEASEIKGQKILIDANYVNDYIGDLGQQTDLSKFIL